MGFFKKYHEIGRVDKSYGWISVTVNEDGEIFVTPSRSNTALTIEQTEELIELLEKAIERARQL